MSKSRQKGTAAESAVVRFLKGHGWPFAERRALHAALDKGDVTSTPALVWEVKNHRAYKFPEWMRETEEERENAAADYGILVVKPNGIGATRVGDWWCVLPLHALTDLLRDAGYGDKR
jgi:hypothetical protein